MTKKLIATAALAAALVAPMAGTAGASNGNANGRVGCTLANDTHYDTPAEMLKYLTERDGDRWQDSSFNNFQNTVEHYGGFDTVADLIHTKCGA